MGDLALPSPEILTGGEARSLYHVTLPGFIRMVFVAHS